MSEEKARLAELIGSRICHDLISPLGAIANGLELLEMSGAARGPELSLVEESARSAGLRIRLFRMAFGAAAPGQVVSAGELEALMPALAGDGRIEISLAAPCELPRAEARLLLLTLLCAETALGRGGRLGARRDRDGRWTVEAQGERLRLEPQLWARLLAPHPPEETPPAEVQFLLARLAADQLGRPITVTHGDGWLRLAF